LEASQQFSFYGVGLLAPRPTPIPEDEACVSISPRGRVATHFSRLLRHAWVTVGLFLFPGQVIFKIVCVLNSCAISVAKLGVSPTVIDKYLKFFIREKEKTDSV
jgi:hypothetical protein